MNQNGSSPDGENAKKKSWFTSLPLLLGAAKQKERRATAGLRVRFCL